MDEDKAHLKIITMLISMLKEKGWATDDDLEITRYLARKPRMLEEIARKHGYSGGNIGVMGDYHPLSGEVYVLYDIDKVDAEQALEIAKRTAANVLANLLLKSD